ncbi:STM3941 family protein [Hymenobacter sublimis]|uniref:PrgI family protein n=1 Tax=Hymenobacter sublimis TaxID=2933777 RepID=A0ABY4J9U7_9BACT|nr:STM3941 family protein [Hymenobacter sublimis]UPL49585.1 hypothetical protein MWH26_01425 [Hymenobacter sublimis]
MMEVKLYKSRWRAIKLLIGCSGFVAVGCGLLIKGTTPQWGAWACILFFGLGYPVGIYHLLDRRPQIILNEAGIFDRMAHNVFINWHIIEDAYLAEVHGQKFICLVVRPELEPSRGKGKLAQKLAPISKHLGFQELNISLGQINVDEVRLLEFILLMSKASADVRVPLLEDFYKRA